MLDKTKSPRLSDATAGPDPEVSGETIHIPAPKFETASFRITGCAPLMQARFSEKTKHMMREQMAAGQTAKRGKTRTPRKFEDDFTAAQYISTDDWNGIHAGAFRMALISACRLANFKMTLAKLTLFIEADGFDKYDGTPLVRIHGTPVKDERAVRNATGVVDIRARPRWDKWHCILRIRWDADQFNLTDVSNLLQRVGLQVGVGEGRPDSKASAGLGFGLFEVEGQTHERRRA
jgi:hypothetical protein